MKIYPSMSPLAKGKHFPQSTDKDLFSCIEEESSNKHALWLIEALFFKLFLFIYAWYSGSIIRGWISSRRLSGVCDSWCQRKRRRVDWYAYIGMTDSTTTTFLLMLSTISLYYFSRHSHLYSLLDHWLLRKGEWKEVYFCTCTSRSFASPFTVHFSPLSFLGVYQYFFARLQWQTSCGVQ